MAHYKYATHDCQLSGPDGLGYNVRANTPWAVDDPLVLANPSSFTDEPLEVGRTVPEAVQEPAHAAPVIESATHAPGEFRRGPGRPRKVHA